MNTPQSKYDYLTKKAINLEDKIKYISWSKLLYHTVENTINEKKHSIHYLSKRFFGNNDITQNTIAETVAILQITIDSFWDLKKEIANSNVEQFQKDFLIKRIDEAILKCEFAKKATFFEAEKSWYTISIGNNEFKVSNKDSDKKFLSMEQKNQYLTDMNDLQTKIYGPKITDTPKEKNIVFSILQDLYEKNKDNLDNDEQILFQKFLEKFNFDYIKVDTTPPDFLEWDPIEVSKIMKATDHIRNNFYNNVSWKQEQPKWRTGYAVYWQNKTREYPDKEKDLFKKLFIAIGHEDAGHMLRGDNQIKNWLVIPWAWYEYIEEGITKLNEGLLKYNLDTYQNIPSDTFIWVFIWENYNYQDTYSLLRIIKKMKIKGEITDEIDKKLSEQANNLAQRVKGYYPWDDVWSNRKDVIYFRWENILVDYLKSLPNDLERSLFYHKLLEAKVSFSDIIAMDDFLADKKDVLNYNKMVDKILYLKLKNGTWVFSKQKNKESRLRPIDTNLLNWDFRFHTIDEYTMKEKRALIEVISLIGYKKQGGKYIREGNNNQQYL